MTCSSKTSVWRPGGIDSGELQDVTQEGNRSGRAGVQKAAPLRPAVIVVTFVNG
jgi:hypothetical protein